MRMSLIFALGLAIFTSVAAGDEPYGDLGDLKIAKPEDKMDVPSTPAPERAIVLFDGKNLGNWVKTDGKTAPAWKILDGGIAQVKGGNLITKQKFDGHFKLHVEFRVPYMPKAKGQARGNKRQENGAGSDDGVSQWRQNSRRRKDSGR